MLCLGIDVGICVYVDNCVYRVMCFKSLFYYHFFHHTVVLFYHLHIRYSCSFNDIEWINNVCSNVYGDDVVIDVNINDSI